MSRRGRALTDSGPGESDDVKQGTEAKGAGCEESTSSSHPWFRTRRASRRRAGSFAPSAEWIAALHAQATPENVAAALGYARKRVDQFRRNGVRVGDDYADAVVQDVLGDTALGVLRWRMDRVSLLDHLKDQIRVRMYAAFVRQPLYRLESLDADRDLADDEERDADADGAALLGDRDLHERVARTEVLEKVVAALRNDLREDVHLDAILRAYSQGVTQRAEIVAQTGMTESDYFNARRRIGRAIAALPPELYESVAEVLST